MGLLLLLAGCNSQNEKPRTYDIMSLYSEQDIQDVIEISASEIERQSGHELVLPEINFVTVTELTDMFLKDDGEETADQELLHYVRSVGAIYDDDRKAVFIVAENFNITASNERGARDEAYYHLLGTMTHELVHALQDQLYGLKYSEEDYSTPDARAALRMTIEGHTELITALVLQQMGVIGELEDYHSEAEHDVDPSDPQAVYENDMSDIYRTGYAFFMYQHGIGGTARAWKILRNPPDRTEVLRKPELFEFQ
ncbi:hypothetical protein [Aliamphritea spongicola]|uniref:hypothetical protein n=1 Tax=Aliamphritea spongicola TaxID=707589 RepID=UPI00196B3073|nr:hypothetical protein [Aliamphritea spongicola]MBN3560810.1 hypothetical protein [Aliamphritea spongicola]